ncbi:LuxR family transcriptional regulator [Streptomyces sp. NPDC018347]|uniref:LuxR family transcriptional regulator n=1 Tax=Streptomyces sp. NPDC018347 TaxID=3157193 RepID=UPI0033FC4D0F
MAPAVAAGRPARTTGGRQEGRQDGAVRLHGRDAVLSVVRSVLESTAAGRGSAVVVRGGSGSGKSALLHWTARTAADAGWRVLRVPGDRLGEARAFAAIRSLVALLDAPAGESPAARAALVHALSGRGRPADVMLVCSALRGVLVPAARRSPVLLLADDCQWLDPASATVLTFLVNRLAGTRVAVVAAVDGEGPGPLTGYDVTELSLPGLDRESAQRVLADHHPDLAIAARAPVLDVAEGNPLALVDLPSALNSAQREGRAALPELMVPGPLLYRTLGERFRELPAGTRALLAVLALADDATEPRDLAWLARSLGHGPDMFGPAEDAGLVTWDRVPRFTRRVLRCLAYFTAPVSVRLRAHTAWAGLGLAGLGSGRPADAAAPAPSGRPGHLETLAQAALAAERWDLAIRTLRHAGDISPTRAERTRLHTTAALVAVRKGQPLLALALSRESASDAAGTLRVVRASALFDTEFHADASGAALTRALAAAPAAAGDVRDWATFQLATLSPVTGRPEPARTALLALRRRETTGDPLRLAVTASLDAVGRAPEIRAGLAVAVGRLLKTPGSHPYELTWLADAAWRIDETALAGRLLAIALRGPDRGRGAHLPHCRVLRAALLTAGGRWQELHEFVAARLPGLESEGLHRQAMALKTQLLLVCAYQGRRERGDELLREVRQWARAHGCAHLLRLAGYAAHLLAQEDGGPAAVREKAWPAGDDRAGNLVTRHAHVDAVRAALALNDVAAARAHHERAVRDGLASFSAEMTLLVRHGQALLSAHTDEPGTAGLFDAARAAARASARPFDRARLALDHGIWLRRRRGFAAARTYLRSAHDDFTRLGALPWQSRARAELRAIGVSPRGEAASPAAAGVSSLSPHEERIVRLAALGLTNREIGDRLEVSPRTVASHLYKVFPRLGVSSRRELARALRDTAEPS